MTWHRASRLVRRWPAPLAALWLLSLPGSAAAQEWDRATYERRAEECVHNLEFAEEAVNAGDTDRALTYIELAVSPCDAARTLLIAGLQSDELSSRNRDTLEGDLVAQDSRWVILAARLGMCDQARQMLAETSRLVPEVPSDTMERYVQASQALLSCVPSDVPTTAQPGPVTPMPQTPVTPTPVTPTPVVPSPLGGAVTVGPGYPATSASGLAGGPVDAMMYGANCRGWLPSQAQFQLSVPGGGVVTAQVTSAADTTLVITGPGGTFCNDDFNGLNPGLSQSMAAGTYQVYVGEYARSAAGSSFDIRFSSEALSAPATSTGAAPTYGTAYLGAGYGPSTLNGVSGGNTQASSRYGNLCTGFIASNPDFALEVSAAATVSVNVTALDGGDTTLVITGPGGTFCNDDYNGLNPGLTQYMPAGQYQVFVGSYYQGQFHNVSMSFSAY